MSTTNSSNPNPSAPSPGNPGQGVASPNPAAAMNPVATDPDMAPSPAILRAGSDDAPPAKEEMLWTGRTSWKHFYPSIGLWFVVTVFWSFFVTWQWGGKSLFWAAIVPMAIIGLFVWIRAGLTVFSTRYRLTDQRIFFDRGILSQTIDQTELMRVDDVRVFKTLMDRVLGLGTVEVVSTDATDKDTTLKGIPNPDQLAETVRSQMKRLRKRTMFVENL